MCCKPVSGTGSYTCDNTACDATKGYYPVPLSSNSHPSKTNTCSKCRTVALDGFCDPFGKNAAGGDNTVDDTCQECCFQRTCTNFDGEGNGFCPCECAGLHPGTWGGTSLTVP